MTSSDSDLAFSTGAWELPEDLRLVRDTARRFVETEVRPLEEKLPHDAAGVPASELPRLQQQARGLGLWALQTPVEFGGAGLSVLGQVLVAEEAAKCRMGAFFPAGGAFGGNPPSVMFQASRDQFERYARPIIEGRAPRAFTAVSEPSGGSDPARAIQCRAERRGDHYVLNGAKTWITHAGRADWGIVYARTGEPGRRDGISCFIVEADAPGLRKTPIGVITSYSPFELNFEDVRVLVENRIGEEGQGFALASDFLVQGRIIYTAGTLGIAQYALDLAVEWVKQRKTFGAPLSERQGIQWMLADSAIELKAARLLTYQAAWTADLGHDPKVDASMCKAFGVEAAYRIVDRCVQVFGGMGVAQELPFERWLRELRVKRLGEGATEIQKIVISRHLLGGN